MSDIYASTIKKAGIHFDDSVLVVCGGAYDRSILMDAGVRNAIISNVDFHAGVSDYSPFEWQHQDAEALTAADASFDWCIVHAGLHHCASPHRAMCEMMRVARKGIVVVEARDSALMRMAILFGMTGDYELEPVSITGGKTGGYRNTKIPNYVYRWTEREVEKTVRSYAPYEKPNIEYSYGYRVPLQRLAMAKSSTKRAIGRLALGVSSLAELLMPRQGNLFSFIVRKGGSLEPWLRETEGGLDVDMAYMNRRFDPSKYGRMRPPG